MRHWDKSCEGTIYAKHAIMLKLLYCYGHGTLGHGTLGMPHITLKLCSIYNDVTVFT